MSYKNITVLADAGNGTLEITQLAIEPCTDATTGWALMTPGDPDPINADELTELMGWGELDGRAIIHGGYRIPVAAIPFETAEQLVALVASLPSAYGYSFFINHPGAIAMPSGPLEDLAAALDLDGIQYDHMTARIIYNDGENAVYVTPRL